MSQVTVTRKGPRWSRPDYNKPHRCPGWSGAGWVASERSTWDCPDGSIRSVVVRPRDEWPASDGREFQRYAYTSEHPWRPGWCYACGVKTYPLALKWLDPHWYRIYYYRLVNWMRWSKGWLKR